MKKPRIPDLIATGACLIFLGGMISPTLERSREQLHRARCVSNLKRLWRAFSAYVQEHDGRLPLAGRCDHNMPEDWTWGGSILSVPQTLEAVDRIEIEKGSIWPYVYGSFATKDVSWYGDARRNIYLCPSAGPVGRKRGLSYSMSSELDGSPIPAQGGTILADVAFPETVVLLLEESEFTVNDGSFIRQSREHDIPQSEVHKGGANHLFCDGHVQWLSREQLETKMESGEGFEWQQP
jgi:prepilin-type processing-associated H-X9-DG protein